MQRNYIVKQLLVAATANTTELQEDALYRLGTHINVIAGIWSDRKLTQTERDAIALKAQELLME